MTSNTTGNASTPPSDSADNGSDEYGSSSGEGLGRTYWMLNSIEMFERLAFFCLRVMAPIYIMQIGQNEGGLHLTAMHKGTIYMWWAIFQSVLPIITGGIADRYGYKRILFISISMNTAGYLIIANFHSYTGYFTGIIVLATRTAFFKPSLQGSIANLLKKKNASLGWGVFYWVVNVGSLAAHYIAGPIMVDRSAGGWQRLFYACAVFSAMNFLLLLAFRDVPSGASKSENPLVVLWRTLVNIFEARLITWLLIMSCFWLMMYQLWDLQPNFIEDWVDSSMVAAHLPDDLHLKEMGDRGLVRVPQQVLISMNALMIVLFVVPVTWLVRRMRTLSAMLIGMLMATAGVLVAGWTGNGWILLSGIALFSLGEMLTGPKKQEYLGLIAPPGKKGMYLGYVNIPVGIGLAVGSKLSGWIYGTWGEKATLALKYLVEKTEYCAGRAWDGSIDTLETVTGVQRTEAFVFLQEHLGIDGVEANQLLWETYQPYYHVWVPFAAIGIVAAVALAVFGQMAKRWSDMNA